MKTKEEALKWWRSMNKENQMKHHNESMFNKVPFEIFTRSSIKIEMVFKNNKQ